MKANWPRASQTTNASLLNYSLRQPLSKFYNKQPWKPFCTNNKFNLRTNNTPLKVNPIGHSDEPHSKHPSPVSQRNYLLRLLQLHLANDRRNIATSGSCCITHRTNLLRIVYDQRTCDEEKRTSIERRREKSDGYQSQLVRRAPLTYKSSNRFCSVE